MTAMKSVRIDNVQELCSLVHQAREAKVSLAPCGGGTQQHRLLPATLDSWQVDLRGMNRIIDYPFDDMTITLQAGVTMAQLHQTLAEHGQTLPIDVPFPEKATVGGSIAANVNGPRRFGWGTWRDYVIGVSFVNDRGEEAKAGGRVVKNVAGYDLCKLLTGSFGTLVIITQVTLKVRPLPQKRAIVPMQIEPDSLGKVAEAIRNSRLRPVLQIVRRTVPLNEGDLRVRFYIGFEESAAAVDWQVEHVKVVCRLDGVDLETVLQGSGTEKILDELTRFPVQESGVTFQLALLPSQAAEALLALLANPQDEVQADVGVGLIHGNIPNSPAISDALLRIRQLRESKGGHCTLLRFPIELAKDYPPFGPERPDWAMMRKVKQALDPDNLFNAGRFPPVNLR
jgi:glycolate oxidase FAD binding subunit